MTRMLEFVFDFASPNAYLADRALGPLLERTGATVAFTPVLLGGVFKLTGNQAPMLAFGGVKGKLAYEQLEMRRFIDRHGLSRFRMNPHFPVNTLTLMRAYVAAEADGGAETFRAAAFRGLWEDGLKLDEPPVIEALLNDAGLDGPSLLARAKDDDVKAKLAANTQAAVDRGVFGIPSFFVGDQLFFGKERLDQIEAVLSA